jgi:hypothetical protein
MSGRGHALSGSVGGAAEREKKREGEGGPAAGVPRGVGRRRGAWLGLAGGVLALTWACPGTSKSGEARVVRGRVWASPRRKWGSRAQMNNTVLHLFELVLK